MKIWWYGGTDNRLVLICADCPPVYLRHDSPTERAQDLDTVIAEVLRQHACRQVVALGGAAAKAQWSRT